MKNINYLIRPVGFFSKTYCLIAMLLGWSAVGAQSAIVQGASDLVLFEAEEGVIDNSFDNPTIGWEVQTGDVNASGQSNIVAAENNTNLPSPQNNSIAYQIDFSKTGTYDVWYRMSYTTEDFEDTRNDAGNNDSFYPENGSIGDGTITFFTVNGGSLATNFGWQMKHQVSVASTGLTDWQISNREDGLQLDRIIFQHTDDTTNSSTFDFLENSSGGGIGGIIPEPSTLGLLFIGWITCWAYRRPKGA